MAAAPAHGWAAASGGQCLPQGPCCAPRHRWPAPRGSARHGGERSVRWGTASALHAVSRALRLTVGAQAAAAPAISAAAMRRRPSRAVGRTGAEAHTHRRAADAIAPGRSPECLASEGGCSLQWELEHGRRPACRCCIECPLHFDAVTLPRTKPLSVAGQPPLWAGSACGNHCMQPILLYYAQPHPQALPHGHSTRCRSRPLVLHPGTPGACATALAYSCLANDASSKCEVWREALATCSSTAPELSWLHRLAQLPRTDAPPAAPNACPSAGRVARSCAHAACRLPTRSSPLWTVGRQGWQQRRAARPACRTRWRHWYLQRVIGAAKAPEPCFAA